SCSSNANGKINVAAEIYRSTHQEHPPHPGSRRTTAIMPAPLREALSLDPSCQWAWTRGPVEELHWPEPAGIVLITWLQEVSIRDEQLLAVMRRREERRQQGTVASTATATGGASSSAGRSCPTPTPGGDQQGAHPRNLVEDHDLLQETCTKNMIQEHVEVNRGGGAN
ncbi:unnamed protein product, partial [Amoebophrya sp. A25]